MNFFNKPISAASDCQHKFGIALACSGPITRLSELELPGWYAMTAETISLPAVLTTPHLTQDPALQIRESVRVAFANTGYRSVATLDCVLVKGTIVLCGVVSSYYLKQIAQEAVLQLRFAHGLRNAIQVRRS